MQWSRWERSLSTFTTRFYEQRECPPRLCLTSWLSFRYLSTISDPFDRKCISFRTRAKRSKLRSFLKLNYREIFFAKIQFEESSNLFSVFLVKGSWCLRLRGRSCRNKWRYNTIQRIDWRVVTHFFRVVAALKLLKYLVSSRRFLFQRRLFERKERKSAV